MACRHYCKVSGCAEVRDSGYGSGCARRIFNNSIYSGGSALNSVAMCQRCENFPFYTGPCPDVNGCYCDSNCCENTTSSCSCNCNCQNNCNCCNCEIEEPVVPCCCGCCNISTPAYGLFTANEPLNVAAGGIIPLVSTVNYPDAFVVSNGTIVFRKQGTFLATYTVRIPSGGTANTTIDLNVNGVPQIPAEVTVSGPGVYSAQTIFTVTDGSMLTLTSSNALNLIGATTSPIFTLSLVEIQ